MSNTKLLIIPQNWLGDIVMSQTLLKKIKFENPDTSIDILVNSKFEGLVKRMPEVNKPFIIAKVIIAATLQLCSIFWK